MKTRQELILDFMLALSAGIHASEDQWVTPKQLYDNACKLADAYLENT